MSGLRQFGVDRTHFRDQQLDGRAFFIRDLSSDQIIGLDAGGAFVDCRDAGIAQVLRGAGFLDEAHAAVHLHAGRCDLDRLLGAPAFDDRREQIEHGLVLHALGFVGMQQGFIQMSRRQSGQCTHGLGLRLHAHQHAAHVRVMDDADPLARLHADFPALDAIARVVERVLVGALCNRNSFDADFEPREIHHGEHELQAAVFLTNQITDGAVAVAVSHDARRTAVDAEFVFDGNAFDVVTLAEAAVLVDQEFRHHEQRNALDTFRRVGRACEHHVDDVLHHVVLAPGDENLGAVDAVMIAFGNGAAAHRG